MIEFNSQEALDNLTIVDEANSILNDVMSKVSNVLNGNNFFGNGDVGTISKLISLNADLQNFILNTVIIYNEFMNETTSQVSPLISEGSILSSLVLENSGLYLAQSDPRWRELGLKYGKKEIGQNGCGPTSITNELALAFGVTDEGTMISLYKDVVALLNDKKCYNKDNATAHNVINTYLTDSNERNAKYTTLNSVIAASNMDFVYTGNGYENFLKALNSSSNDTVLVSRINFNDANYKDGIRCERVYTIIDTLYEKGIDMTLNFGHVSVGNSKTDRPFRTGSGHYVGVSLNVNEFMEEGTLYIIDSYPRNIEGEDYTVLAGIRESSEMGKATYSFTDSFNETFEVSHLSDTVLRVTVIDGEWSAKDLAKLGLSGSSSLIAIPNTVYENITLTNGLSDNEQFNNLVHDIIPQVDVTSIMPESSLTQNMDTEDNGVLTFTVEEDEFF